MSASAVKGRAQRLGLRTGTRDRYSAAELERIRELWPTHTIAAVAADLGRSVTAVWLHARRIGLTEPRFAWPEEIKERVRLLHAAGLGDPEITDRLASEFGRAPDRRQVCYLRKSLGLPVPAAALLEARRRGVLRQAEVLGIRPGGQLRALAHQRFAGENGWPDGIRARGVQILNVLARLGPRTKNQLAAAIGARWRGVPSRKVLVANGPGGSYLAQLIALGFVGVIHRGLAPSKGQGKGRAPSLYLLTPAAIAWREQHGQRAPQVETGRGAGADPAPAGPRRVGRSDADSRARRDRARGRHRADRGPGREGQKG